MQVDRASEEQDRDWPSHSRNLRATIQELEDHIAEAERRLASLNQPASSSSGSLSNPRPPPSPPPLSPSRRLEILRTAFADVARSDPFLPFPHSVLPALLALRHTHRTIAESQACLAGRAATVEQTRRELETDRALLVDQRALGRALERRLAAVRADAATASAAPASNPSAGQAAAARETLEALRRERSRYDRETGPLMRELLRFIDQRLGLMIAAEEMGGPVVGDLMDLDANVLALGFDEHGQPKRARGGRGRGAGAGGGGRSGGAAASGQRGAAAPDGGGNGQRQLRLDQIWGPATRGQEATPGRGRTSAAEGGDEAAAAAAAAAAAGLRSLLEDLMNSLQAGGAASYVAVNGDSAAVRFLVRARVAQLHPRDASRLRLVDFGRELDD